MALLRVMRCAVSLEVVHDLDHQREDAMKNKNPFRGERPSGAIRSVGALVTSTAIVLSQVLPAYRPVVAYAEEQVSQPAGETTDKQALYAMWDDVLDAMDAEAVARAKLNSAQNEATELEKQIAATKANLEADEAEKAYLQENIEELVDFANDPTPNNRAYTDTIMDVVESIENLTDAQGALGDAKSAYATARQALADLNAELTTSEDGKAIEAAQATLDGATADLQVKTSLMEEAQAQLDDANTALSQALDEVDDANKASYGKAQEDVATKAGALEKATADRVELEGKVAEDQQKLAEQGDSAIPYTMAELGTPGQYMDGIDISTYQDGIDLSQVPVDFVIVKAMEGPNPLGEWCLDEYESKVDQALAEGKCVGLYHFYSTNATPEEQARRFVEQSKAYVGKVAFFLDWESRTYNGGWGGYGESPVATLDPAVAKAWLDTVYELTGVKPGIYMSRSVTAMHDWSEVAAEYPLWVAAYPSTDPIAGYTDAYKEPYDGNVGAWASPLIWQYSSTTYLDNWGGWLDVNVMYGNAEDWSKLVGQNWQTRLENDQKLLNEAVQAEQAAKAKHDEAVSAAETLAAEIRLQSSDLDAAFSLVAEKTSDLNDKSTAVNDAQAYVSQCEATLGELEKKNEALLNEIAEAEKNLDEASATIAECNQAIETAQTELEAREHKKDMFKRIFEIAQAGTPTESGTSDDTTRTAGMSTATSDGNPVGTLVAAFAPTVAMAATSGNSIMPEGFPVAKDIIANPSVLDSFIEATDNDDIKELLSDIKADALRINEIGVEAKEKTATYEELEKKLESLKEEIPELETKVAETQVQVENARTAYSSASPDGTIEAPEGYKDQRKIPETGAPEDHGLVSLWVEMFVLVGALIVLFVKFEEQRDKRRRKA